MNGNPVRKAPRGEAKKKEFYVSNKELLNQIIISKEKGELTKDALSMLIKMSNEVTNKMFSFKYPEERDDILQSALLDCVSYWKGFKPEISSNAFAYYTQIIKNGCAKGFKKLHPYKDSKMISISKDGGLYNF